jgi:hypothetical protein
MSSRHFPLHYVSQRATHNYRQKLNDDEDIHAHYVSRRETQ